MLIGLTGVFWVGPSNECFATEPLNDRESGRSRLPGGASTGRKGAHARSAYGRQPVAVSGMSGTMSQSGLRAQQLAGRGTSAAGANARTLGPSGSAHRSGRCLRRRLPHRRRSSSGCGCQLRAD